MTKLSFIVLAIEACLASCSTHKLPPFSSQEWLVDPYSGNAVSTSGLELAFGSEWMIMDTTLMQSPQHIAGYPELSAHLANGIAQFPEIKVDSILFYNPHRRLLFVSYHQFKPLKPTSEITLYEENGRAYSEEYARLFGNMTTYIDDSMWENGPINSAYINMRYIPGKKLLAVLTRFPGDENIAVLQVRSINQKAKKWSANYPAGTIMYIDLGNLSKFEQVSSFLQSSRNLAVENLKLILSKQQP